MSVQYKACERCSDFYSEAFFYSKTNVRSHGFSQKYKEPVCIGCQLNERTKRKQRNRPREKARRTLNHHADKYIKQGLADSRGDFAQKFGWDLEQMTKDIGHAYANGCPYCHQMFVEMGNGLSDLTLDILDPEKLPFYETNAFWACATCNQEKQRTPPELWGQKLQDWKRWRKRQSVLEIDQGYGTLFEGHGADFSATTKPLTMIKRNGNHKKKKKLH